MYYINPLTDRVIKSTGKTYQKLKQRRFKLHPDHCLYNNTTARRCMLSLLRKYPNIYLSSSYTNIPATYSFFKKSDIKTEHKQRDVRAFIEKEPGIASGYITKDGTLFKLNKDIQLKPNDIVIKTASNTDSNLLLTNLDDSQVISPDTQDIIEQHIKDNEPISDSVNIVYNPLKNDFIPVNGEIDNISDIIYEYNNSEPEMTKATSKVTEPEMTEATSEVTEPEMTEVTEPEMIEMTEVTEPEMTEATSEATSEDTSEVTEPEMTEVTEPEMTEVTEPEMSEVTSEVTEPEMTEVTEPEMSEVTSEVTEPEMTEVTSEVTEPEMTEATSEVIEPEMSEVTSEVTETPYRGLKIITDKDDNVIGFI
jgi:hypothetical protein